MESVAINPTQVHLLKMFSYAKTDAAFEEIKKALSLYFAKRVSDDMDALWDSGKWSQKKNVAILDEHFNSVKESSFPVMDIKKIDEFSRMLSSGSFF